MLEFVWWCKLQIGLDRDWLLAIFLLIISLSCLLAAWFIGWDSSDWVLAMFPLPTWNLLCVCQEFASGCQLCLNGIQGGLHYINLGLNIWDLHLKPQFNVSGRSMMMKGVKPTWCCFCLMMVVSDEGTFPLIITCRLAETCMEHGTWNMKDDE